MDTQTSPVAVRLWSLMTKRAQRLSWVGLAIGDDASWQHTWISDSVTLHRADAIKLDFATALENARSGANFGSVVSPTVLRVGAISGEINMQTLRNAAAGVFRVAALVPRGQQVSEEELSSIADLWDASLLASRAADEQHELVREQAAIIEHITDGLLVVDRDMTVKHMNAAAGRILNLNPRASLGKEFGSLLGFQPIIRPIVDSGEGYVDRELIVDSPLRHLHLIDTAIPIKDKAGRVVSIVNSFREIQRVRRMADKVAGNHARYTFESIIGTSPALTVAVNAARKAARGFANVLLLGESGVGKEVFAQAIHNASDRASGPFVAINCAALPRDLIESELFGYAPGSFTGASREGRPGKFEAATGGTIFLDEISELPIDVQAKLLRVLQEREVVRVGDSRGIPIDVRVISASNRDLLEMSQRREFREDLYYRCHVIGIALPPLRERQEDVPILVNQFLRLYSQLLNRQVFQVSQAAMARLSSYAWPGNVRELQNMMERLVNMVDEETIEVEHLPELVQPAKPASISEAGLESGWRRGRTLQDIEEEAVASALREYGFNVTEASKQLGISKPTLYAKIKAYRIPLQRGVRRTDEPGEAQ